MSFTQSPPIAGAVTLPPSLDEVLPPRHADLRLPADIRALPKFTKSVSMLAWGYNEELLVEDFLNRAVTLLDSTVEEWEIVFVNDGSTDRTGQILDEFARQDPRIKPVHNPVNVNVGESCKRAIRAASKDYLFWQTVDWSYDIKYLRIFLELLKHYDVVQGIRPVPIRLLSYIPVLRSIYRVKRRSDTPQKAIVSLSNYYLIRILFRATFHDFQNVTFYPTRLIQSVPLKGTSSFLNPECLLRTFEKGTTFIEVPIPFIPRTVGQAKGTKISSIIRSIKDIFAAWLMWGWQFAFQQSADKQLDRIHRVAEPFKLPSDVVYLVAPLFREFG